MATWPAEGAAALEGPLLFPSRVVARFGGGAPPAEASPGQHDSPARSNHGRCAALNCEWLDSDSDALDPRDNPAKPPPGKIESSFVLILSRFAGAAEQMTDALLVNPHSAEDISDALRKALSMSQAERIRRWRNLMANVERQDIVWWLDEFTKALEGVPVL